MASRRYKERTRGRSVLDGDPRNDYEFEGNDYMMGNDFPVMPDQNPTKHTIPDSIKRDKLVKLYGREWPDHMPNEGGLRLLAPPRERSSPEINPAIQQIMDHYKREAYLRNQFPDALGRGTGLIPERQPMDGDYYRMWGEGGYKGDAVSKGEGFDPALVDFAKGLFSSVGDKVQKGKDAATTTAMNVMEWLKGLR